MKQRRIRLLGLLLAAVMLLGCLPVQALAAGSGSFYLVADRGGELLIAPERVCYTADQTIFEALNASGHSFGPDADDISKIDGQSGNFSRSDETGSHDLKRKAAEAKIQYLCFTDQQTAQPSAVRKNLIAAMADYRQEEPDVQLAAKEAYDAACAGYCAADGAALSLYTDLHNAVEQYRQTLNGQKYTVTFKDTNKVWDISDKLYAKNQYGRVYEDTGHSGKLQLPAGSYTFTMQTQTGGVTGSITVPGQTSVTAAFDTSDWLKPASFQLSTGAEEKFDSSQLQTEKSGRSLQTVAADSFTGTLYAYWPFDTEKFSNGTGLTLTAVYTPAGGTEQRQEPQALKSKVSGIDGVLAAGVQGNTVVYRASTQDERGMTQYQDYTLTIRRMPTLKTLRVTEANGTAAALDSFDESTRTYTWKVLSEQVTLSLMPTETDGCRLYVDGKDVTEAKGCTLTIDKAEKHVTVEVQAGGETTQYTLILQKTTGCKVRIPVESRDVTVTVCDTDGQMFSGAYSTNSRQYQFILVPGVQYTYTATKNTYYHTTGSFTAAADLTLPSVTVQTDDWLTELSLGKNDQSASKGSLALDKTFSRTEHTYTAIVPDTISTVYLWLNGDVATAKTTFSVRYNSIASTSARDDQPQDSGNLSLGSPAKLNYLLLSKNGRGNTLTVRCQRTSGDVTYYQDYIVTLQRSFSLENLSIACGGQMQALMRGDGSSGYTASVWDYTVTVPATATELTVSASVYSVDGCCRDGGKPGYHVWLGEQELQSGEAAVVKLTGTEAPESFTLTLKNEFADEELASEYHIQVRKAQPLSFTPQLTPADALLFVVEPLTGQRIWPDADGAYALSDGFTYRYLLTRTGYAGRSGTLKAAYTGSGTLVLQIDEASVPVKDGAAAAEMTIEAAPKNDTLLSLPAEWADFRGMSYAADGTAGGSAGSNNAVISGKTPVDADKATLYWSNALGSGRDNGATGCPLLVDDALIVYAGDTIYRVDPVSGEILKQAKMDHASDYATVPPTYAKGMVFVGLADGTIQAFNAKTLESLWIYRDALGGQPNCPITICGDYLYTGFWRYETTPANFVCLSITDEDPSNPKEEKTARWYWTADGGYYWAGAYACEDYVLVGTDDGTAACDSMTGSLLMLDAKTGQLLDKWSGLCGDVRSTVCYDSETEAFYFTTKGGWFCGVKTERTADGWRLQESSKWTRTLDNGVSDSTPMSTSTPVVHNGRAYVGVSGKAQFDEYSGHNITVMDLASRKIAYRVHTQGYPQTSGVLTTAHEANSQTAYVYFVDNYTPGKLRVLRDRPGQTTAQYVTEEDGVQTPYVLFTPSGKDAQYAICSPIVDPCGVMYFKNDSASLMAFGPSVTLEIVSPPNTTQYQAGAVFDPTGMQVGLVYENGLRRDVTKYVEWTKDPLTADDANFEIRFPYVKYHDQDTESGREINVKTQTPTAAISLTISSGTAQSGRIGTLTWTYDAKDGAIQVSGDFEPGQTLAAACYDQNGALLQTRLLTKTQTSALLGTGARVRLFLLDQENRPVCGAVTVKG